MALQTIQLQHIPLPHEVHIAAFKNVTNSSFLHDQLLASNPNYEYSFVDASVIASATHILAAIHQAVHKFLITKKLRTRNVHSEIVFCLSPNNNIRESFQRFGITPTTTSLLCIKISSPDKPISSETVEPHLKKIVAGTCVKFGDDFLAQETDWSKVAKYYEIKTADKLKIAADFELDVLGKLVMRVVG